MPCYSSYIAADCFGAGEKAARGCLQLGQGGQGNSQLPVPVGSLCLKDSGRAAGPWLRVSSQGVVASVREQLSRIQAKHKLL